MERHRKDEETKIVKVIDNVSVHDPMKQGEGMTAFVSYKVTCDIRMKANDKNATKSHVVRRFSDFLWLYRHLVASYPGMIVPVLPERERVKTLSKRITASYAVQRTKKTEEKEDKLIQYRKQYLELFMRRIIIHETLSRDRLLFLFVTLDNDTFEAQKAKIEQEPENLLTSQNLKRVANEINQLIFRKGSVADKVTVPSSTNSKGITFYPDDDLAFMRSCKCFLNMETYAKEMSKLTHESCTLENKLASGLANVATCFNTFSRAEDDTGLSSQLSALSAVLLNCSELLTVTGECVLEEFHEPMKDFYRQLRGVLVAIITQRTKKKQYETAKETLNQRLAKINKAGVDVSKEAQAVQLLGADVEEITTVLKQELRRFNDARFVNFKEMIVTYAKRQITTQQIMLAKWKAALSSSTQ